ncbi:MAG: SlyX family protein [Vibrionaceae bacterium]
MDNSNNAQWAKRQEELEIKVSFLETAVEELSDALSQQQNLIDTLTGQLRFFANKRNEAQPSQLASLSEETPPPHY